MKYKLIKSMAHNWTHSFMSGMNYVDGDYVFEDMYQLARGRRGEKITVSWIPERTDELFVLTPRIRESLKHYRKSLPTHMRQHNVDVGAISEMRTEVYVAEDHRIYVRSYVLDNRGKEHVQFVRS
ncbi:hypothetical protein JI752_016705 [Lysobacter sp. MMG2]|uniref:hypothetical protein n=1 Tax=Lysobacter sp. MMG2 TaxID=2801338 RepID=UPI001C21F4FB|nr:hypothetical protein [Lysobacter sp. MMG2]MBU8977789.1 hypothetical protein [Lysobacter sp. MMG2]